MISVHLESAAEKWLPMLAGVKCLSDDEAKQVGDANMRQSHASADCVEAINNGAPLAILCPYKLNVPIMIQSSYQVAVIRFSSLLQMLSPPLSAGFNSPASHISRAG